MKKEAETHALKVIHSVSRYDPGHRPTVEQLLADSDWIKLMKLCEVEKGERGILQYCSLV